LAAVYTQGTVIGHEIAAEEINAKYKSPLKRDRKTGSVVADVS